MNKMGKILLFMLLALHARIATAEKILVFYWLEGDFKIVHDSMASGIGQHHQVIDHLLTDSTTYREFKEAIVQATPKVVVLMDNASIKLWLELTEKNPDLAKKFVAVGAMALNLKVLLKGKSQITGIAHEVPGFTIISRFSAAVNKPVKNVLVPYRSSKFEYLVEDAKQSLKMTGINVIPVNVENSSPDRQKMYETLDGTLGASYNGVTIDAIWVLNDSGLVNGNTFQQVWIKKAEILKIPFLCSINEFVVKKLHFCSYAASANNVDMGQQLSEMILAIVDDQAGPSTMRIEYLQSVEETVNDEMLERAGFTLNSKTPIYMRHAN